MQKLTKTLNGTVEMRLAKCKLWGTLEDNQFNFVNEYISRKIVKWNFIGRTDAETETPKLRPPDAKNWHNGKDPDAGKDWRQEKGNNRGWDGWMVSQTPWTWVSVNSGSWWCTMKPGMLGSMRSQRDRHNWATELKLKHWYLVIFMNIVNYLCVIICVCNGEEESLSLQDKYKYI